MENVVKRSIRTEKFIQCPKYIHCDVAVEKCGMCNFCKAINDNDVECLYNRAIMLKSVHVTSFTSGDYEYKAVELDDETYQKHKEEIEKTQDCCCLCCFNQKLKNGNEICLLRFSTADEHPEAFCCHENEYWFETKRNTEK